MNNNILKINKNTDDHLIQQSDLSVYNLLNINIETLNLLNVYKNKITKYYENKKWEKYKKIIYKFENISKIKYNFLYNNRCISRGFYKLTEIFYYFEKKIFKNNPMNVLFLSEGPGGFYQAFIEKRHKLYPNVHSLPQAARAFALRVTIEDKSFYDNIYGITLTDDKNTSIPNWNIPYNLKKYINILYGKYRDGNLYNYQNIENIVNIIGLNSLDFITADGGFDFSDNFNQQEVSSFKLLICQILCALLLQKEDGLFIIKIYDMFLDTIKLIHILNIFYKDIYIIKPLSSRPANSEKYIICESFIIKDKEYYNNIIEKIKNSIIKDDRTIILEFINYDKFLLQQLVSYNLYYTINQINIIQQIIDNINEMNTIESINNRNLSIEWFNKFLL